MKSIRPCNSPYESGVQFPLRHPALRGESLIGRRTGKFEGNTLAHTKSSGFISWTNSGIIREVLTRKSV